MGITLIGVIGALVVTGTFLQVSAVSADWLRFSPTVLPSAAPGPQGLLQQAYQQIAGHDWATAEQTLFALLAAQPDDARASLLLGMLLAPVDPDRAVPWLEQAAQEPSQVEAAQRVLEVLTHYEPFRSDFYTALGLVLSELDEWALAERALRLALEVNAANPIALAYLGYAVDRQGADGGPWLEQARAMAPTDPQVLYLVGIHWRQAGDLKAAEHALLQAYWAAPDNPAPAAEIGRTLQAQGDLAGAERWLRIAVGLKPKESLWAELLASFYAETGFGLDGYGIAFLQEAGSKYPDSSTVRACLGWALYRLGDAQKALDELRAATTLDPADARAHYYLGAVQEWLGEVSSARSAYSTVLSLVPRDSYYGELAARGLARLSAGMP